MLAQNLSLTNIKSVGFNTTEGHYAITDNDQRIKISRLDYFRILRGDEPQQAPFGLAFEMPTDVMEDFINFKMYGEMG